jgi:hypothetical protein
MIDPRHTDHLNKIFENSLCLIHGFPIHLLTIGLLIALGTLYWLFYFFGIQKGWISLDHDFEVPMWVRWTYFGGGCYHLATCVIYTMNALIKDSSVHVFDWYLKNLRQAVLILHLIGGISQLYIGWSGFAYIMIDDFG